MMLEHMRARMRCEMPRNGTVRDETKEPSRLEIKSFRFVCADPCGQPEISTWEGRVTVEYPTDPASSHGLKACPRCGVLRAFHTGRGSLCRDCRSVLTTEEIKIWEGTK